MTYSEARKLTLFAVLGLVLVALALASGYAMANRYELVAQQEGLWSRGKKDLQPSKSSYRLRAHTASTCSLRVEASPLEPRSRRPTSGTLSSTDSTGGPARWSYLTRTS